ncbi:hypothetical protein CEXT_663551 [Caerostris extrusa]|uniref:Uncharacterized protein n=1 Tax=Caerostris extrusa TaxID=172846 RepID=A0AAV4Q199_CAEEX|nr:hypothetical protein CEXT_663551 [Caerostris extrusa]
MESLPASDYRSVKLLTTSIIASCENLKTGFSFLPTEADFAENLPTFERGGLAAYEETSTTVHGLIPDSRLAATLNLTTTAQNATMDIDSALSTDINDDILHVKPHRHFGSIGPQPR